MNSLSARNIDVRIGDAIVLSDVSLDLRAGEMLALLGPNGAGKSTLLRTLSGEIVPAGGSVAMNGRSLADWSDQARARTRAVLAQQSSLSFALTVLEVVTLGRLPWIGVARLERDATVIREALAAADVVHLASRRYTTLSGGERQRVHLARVLAQVWDAPKEKGRYLLFDEPIAGLDLPHQHETLAIASRFAADGFGVLVVLHDMNLAAQYAGRLALMKDGRIVRTGSPWDVLQSDIIDSVFGVPTAVIPHPLLPIPFVMVLRSHPNGMTIS